MAITSLHYLKYDSEAIWKTMQMNYAREGGGILYPGDEKYMLLRSVLADIVQVFAGVDSALVLATLQGAEGEYLDAKGDDRDCPRISAEAATAMVTITTNATGRSGTLAAGAAMTADGSMFYLLAEDVELDGTAKTIQTMVIADRVGASGNGLVSGTQMELVEKTDQVNSIIVATDAAGGKDEEEDEAYRERIRTYGLVKTTTGPYQQYESVTEAVSSVILDAKAVNGGGGKVNVYVILSTQEGAAALIQDIEDALSADSVRPLNDEVTVAQADDVPYTLKVEYICDGSSATLAAIEKAASDYQKWQDNEIGRAFNPDRLMAAIYQAGATRVTWGTGSEFDGGSVEYTGIDTDERCKGTITLTEVT